MTIIPIDTAVGAPSRPLSATPRLVPVRSGRWRVVDGAGRIIGHLDDVSDQHGSRFRASRYRRATGALVTVGEFHRRTDAVDALRYAG